MKRIISFFTFPVVLLLLVACSTGTTTIIQGADGGSAGAGSNGGNITTGDPLPSNCTPQSDSLTRDNCTGPGEQTLVSCPQGFQPPGCGLTILPTSFCCPTPHASPDAEIQAFCANTTCDFGKPSDCEGIVEYNRRGPCAAEFNTLFACVTAPGVDPCATERIGGTCRKPAEAYVACAIVAKDPSCKVDESVPCNTYATGGTTKLGFTCAASAQLGHVCGETINDTGICCNVTPITN